MLELITVAIIAATAYLITLTRAIGWRRVLRHSVKVDIAGTILLALLFSGTYIGTAVGVSAGFLIAIFLTACKKFTQLPQTIKQTLFLEEKACYGR